jgi:hypothetical protein
MVNQIEKALLDKNREQPFGVKMALVLIREGEDVIDQLLEMGEQLKKAAKVLRKGGPLKSSDIEAFQHIRRLHASWEEEQNEEDEPDYADIADLTTYMAKGASRKKSGKRKQRRTRRGRTGQ